MATDAMLIRHDRVVSCYTWVLSTIMNGHFIQWIANGCCEHVNQLTTHMTHL